MEVSRVVWMQDGQDAVRWKLGVSSLTLSFRSGKQHSIFVGR